MSSTERQIENLLARWRELEQRQTALEASASQPASWIRRAFTEDHFLFTLAADLSGSSAAAEIRTMDDATQVAASATVINTLGQFSHLVSGNRGICAAVDGVYYVVHPDGSGEASAVTFTLTANLAGTVGATAAATVDVSGDPELEASDPITVVNTTTKKGSSGAKGWAIKIAGDWWVVEINQFALLATATLSSATHDISTGYTNNGSIARKQTTTISAMTAISTYPHSFIPGTLPNLDNPRNLLGLSGDKATVAYNRTEDLWEILEIRPAAAKLARIKLTANWPAGTTASATSFTVIANESEVGGELPTITSVKDTNSLAMNARTNDTGLVKYNYVLEGWELVSITHTSTLWLGTVKTPGFSSTPSSFTVVPYIAYNGTLPSGDQTVYNIFGWASGTTGKYVAVIWNPVDSQWEPLQMGCP